MRQASALGRPQAWLLPLERSARTLVSYRPLARSCLHAAKNDRCRRSEPVHAGTSSAQVDQCTQ